MALTPEQVKAELDQANRAVRAGVRYAKVLRLYLEFLEGRLEVDLQPDQDLQVRTRGQALKATFKQLTGAL